MRIVRLRLPKPSIIRVNLWEIIFVASTILSSLREIEDSTESMTNRVLKYDLP